jgi:hypothetical protein
MNYKGIEFSLKSVEPGIWKYRFQVGRAIKTGATKVSHEHLAIQRVEKRIDRELVNAELAEPSTRPMREGRFPLKIPSPRHPPGIRSGLHGEGQEGKSPHHSEKVRSPPS